MQKVLKVHVPNSIVFQTANSLRKFGERGYEGLVFWLGHIEETSCSVEKVMTPPQQSIRSEEGVGYFITSETLLEMNKFLSASGLRLIAQVHSHPGSAYHSPADDRYCIVTVEGGLSIVVPDFGSGPADLYKWAFYRLTQGQWKGLTCSTVQALFITDQEPPAPNDGFISRMKKRFL